MKGSSLVRNIASLSVVQIVNYIFPLLTVPYVSRIIGPDGYGLINYSTAFIGYFVLLITYGFDLTATRSISRLDVINEKNDIEQIVSKVFTSRVILFILSILVFLFCLFYIETINRYSKIVIILFVGCIANIISPQFILQGLQELTIFAKANFVRGVLNICLIFSLIRIPEDYIIIPIINTSLLILINLSLFIYSLNKFNIRLSLCGMSDAFKVLFSERMVFFSTVVISLYTTTNVVVLGFFVSPIDVGYYTTGQSFLAIANSALMLPVSTALFPFVGKSFSVSKENGIEVVKRILPIVFYITLLTSILLFLLAPVVIKLIYGSRFDNSILPLRIMSFIPFIIGISNILGIQLMLNLRLDKLFFRVTFIASIIGVILNFFMSRQFGYIGTAYSWVFVECFVTLSMYFVLRYYNINVFVGRNFRPSVLINQVKNLKK